MFLKWIRGVICLPFVLIYYIRFKLSKIDFDFWDYIYDVIIKTNGSVCLSKWLLISAIADRSPSRLVRLYPVLRKSKPDMILSNRFAIAFFESAVWQKEKLMAKSIIDLRNDLVPSLSDQSARRLECLYLWRFCWKDSEVADLSELMSSNMPHKVFLPYVDYMARGTLADSLEKRNDALLYYRKALRTIPQGSSEYRYIMERCNYILNKDVAR